MTKHLTVPAAITLFVWLGSGCSDESGQQDTGSQSSDQNQTEPESSAMFFAAPIVEATTEKDTFRLISEPNCVFPAPKKVPGVNFYVNADGKGDTPDPALVEKNSEAQRPLRSFLLSAAKALDGTPKWGSVRVISKNCVNAAFEHWASVGAFLDNPDAAAGYVQRVLYTAGLNVTALKLKNSGQTLSPQTIGWLHSLTKAVLKNYGLYGYHHKGFHNNISAWSGAAAATFLAVVRAEPKYADIVQEERELYLESLRGIAADGIIKSEMERGKNALSYSAYYFSALAMNLEARKTYGYSETPYAKSQLNKYLSNLEKVLCDSSEEFFKKAGVQMSPAEQAAKKAEVKSSGLRLLFGLNKIDLTNSGFKRCLTPIDHTVDPAIGGDAAATLKAFKTATWAPKAK